MRRITWIVAIAMCMTLILSACGKKDAGSVVQDLDHVINNLSGYKGSGKMVLHTGQEPQEYDVEVWYQKPHFYRIVLSNAKKDVTQIVLRNDDGVFVLTPQLNKSFRFQSNWPDQQGQVYLYQSLARSIVDDHDRQFVQDNGLYVFDVLANYQNSSLARQKVWLEPKSYAPKRVEVTDASGKLMIGISFDQFEFGSKFEKDSFEMQRNMTSWQIQSLPTLVDVLQEGKVPDASDLPVDLKEIGEVTGSLEEGNSEAPLASGPKQQVVMEPSYMPSGVKLQDIKDVDFGGRSAVLQRYSGTYHYTLLQHQPLERTVSILPGEFVDLGFTMGVVVGDDLRTLSWVDGGIEFRLSTGDLPLEEMVKVATSLQYEMGK